MASETPIRGSSVKGAKQMKISDHVVLQRLFVCASLAVLAACNNVSQFSPLSGARQESVRPSLRTKDFKTIYVFQYGPDGANPGAGLTAINGTFYGTTSDGGSGICVYSGNNYGCGTVFSVAPAGQEQVIYSFNGGSDGHDPEADLTVMRGGLYGTTYRGGVYGGGTVFAVTTGGKEKVLHSFGIGSGPDGSGPLAALVSVRGTLYGTTYSGGAYGDGTVFSISMNGKEQVLHSFGSSSDGKNPAASLIDVNGALYGTTIAGGAACYYYGGTCGTVFAMNISGSEKVLYAFKAGNDGARPCCRLVALNGLLYGTTGVGGGGCPASSYRCGTIFSITTRGKEKVLYRFQGGSSDGQNPGDLTVINGLLYGTTHHGGGTYSSCDCGTIFSATTSGQEKVLHRFKGTMDGASPNDLISLKKVLYGTTRTGAYQLSHMGTVFRLSP
jgi:uncharacterized repeat protein (TIGR03803 family)